MNTKRRRINVGNNGGVNSKSDRLSSLPDPILADILSLIPITSAVSSAVLSRRWRCIWTQLTAIRHCTLAIQDFFSLLFPRLIFSSKIVVLEFYDSFLPPPSSIAAFEAWIAQVCHHRPMKKIELDFKHCGCSPLLSPPSSLFRCQTLESLVLGKGLRYQLLGNFEFRLMKLRKLHIGLCHENRIFTQKLVMACHALEDLWVYGQPGDASTLYIHITSKNLKHLRLSSMRHNNLLIIRIDAPKLEYFHAEGTPKLIRCRFAKPPRFLVKAKLFIGSEAKVVPSWTWELLESVSSVKALSFSCEILPPPCYANTICEKVFHSLTKLKIELEFSDCWRPLMRFLLDCFSLQELVIRRSSRFEWGDMKWSQLGCPLPPCLSTNVKMIRMQNLRGEKSELGLISFLLSIANVLETLDVSVVDTENKATELGFCQDLFVFPRSSPNCQVDFFGMYINLSSNGMKTKDADVQVEKG